MAAEHPAKRSRTAPPSDADDNALPEPEPEKPALQAGEEPVIAEYSAEQSTGAPITTIAEIGTNSNVFDRDCADLQKYLNESERILRSLNSNTSSLARDLAGLEAHHRVMCEILNSLSVLAPIIEH